MSIHYKPGIMDALKAAGFSSYKLRKEKIFGERTMQEIRTEGEIPYPTLNKLCEILHCPISDIIEYTPDGITKS